MKPSKCAEITGVSEKKDVALWVAMRCASSPMRVAGSVSSSHTVLSSVQVAGSIDLLDVTVQSDCNVAGSCKLTDVRIAGDCAVAGSAKLVKVTVGGLLRVAGTCRANNLVVQDASSTGLSVLNNVTVEQALEAWGGLTIMASKVHGITKVHATHRGSFVAEKTTFKDVEIIVDHRSGRLTMTKVQVDFVIIYPKPRSGLRLFGLQIIPPVRKATLILDATIVDGDIDFQSLQGSVVLRNGAQVRGQILGGIVVAE